jgi:hypothetical protein
LFKINLSRRLLGLAAKAGQGDDACCGAMGAAQQQLDREE